MTDPLSDLEKKYQSLIAKIPTLTDEEEIKRVAEDIVATGDLIESGKIELGFYGRLIETGAKWLRVYIEDKNKNPYVVTFSELGKFPIEQYASVNEMLRNTVRVKFSEADSFQEHIYGGIILNIRRMEGSLSIPTISVQIENEDGKHNIEYLRYIR